ncbi:S1 RNA-binding domain-containing protein [Desulfovibrio sp. OttesenSCG-928-I05]|nr:S1 RNA-binding domain-containing protein [Desulfovibrio sp. OttesenSCG-928-I05]
MSEAQKGPNEMTQDETAQSPAAQVEAPSTSDTAPAACGGTTNSEPAQPASEEPAPENESFAELFAAQEAEQTPGAHLSPGQRVTVSVVAVTADTVFVSTGSKVDGIVDLAELDPANPPAIGDQLDLYVVTVSAQEVKLSKMMSGQGGLAMLEEAREARLPVEGKVKAEVKGGFAVEIMKRRAFCPMGQMDLRPVTDAESFIGKSFPFVITKLEKGGRNIVVSRRILLEGEQAENRAAFLATVKEGDVVEGTVVRVAPFGAFVELSPGVEGLVHLSELSWSRVGQAEDAVTTGQVVKAKILGISETDKGPRISLSTRQATDDPWATVSATLHEGEIVSGKVIRLAPFGVFVEVLPGVEGLIHISELSYEKRVNKPEEIVKEGEMVSIKIKGIDLDKKRLSLSLRDVGGNPWDTVNEDFAIDQEVTGTVEKRAQFGLFVNIAPGITGLVPASSISNARDKGGLDKAQEGASVTVVIREIDSAAHRITLGIPGASEDDAPVSRGPRPARGGRGDRPARSEDRDWQKHAPKAEPGSFGGTLGLALQAAQAKKK